MPTYGFDLSIVGDVVKRNRERKGMTQDKLAEVFGVDSSYISKIENGDGLSLSLMIGIAEELDFSLEELRPHRANKRELDLFLETNSLNDKVFKIFLATGRSGVQAYREALLTED